ncbi:MULTISPECIES: hypothetical protein [unclassified Neisseria]|nr:MULTISPECIES: hypothetical protein [unclassified Neisseria]
MQVRPLGRTSLTTQDFGSRLELAAFGQLKHRAFYPAKTLLRSAAPTD